MHKNIHKKSTGCVQDLVNNGLTGFAYGTHMALVWNEHNEQEHQLWPHEFDGPWPDLLDGHEVESASPTGSILSLVR